MIADAATAENDYEQLDGSRSDEMAMLEMRESHMRC